MVALALLLLGTSLAGASPVTVGSAGPGVARAASASVTSSVQASTYGPGEWDTFMGNTWHTSNQPVSDGLTPSASKNLSLLWSFQTGGNVVSEPIVVGNTVYFGSWDDNEYALNAQNGSVEWATNLGSSHCSVFGRPQGITSTATVENGTVYVGGGGPYWYALSATNGSVLWSVFTGNNSPTGPGAGHYNWGSSLIYGGYAYFGISSNCDHPLVQGQVLKVSLALHKVVGVFNTTTLSDLGATVWSTPAINPLTDRLFFATGNLAKGNNTTLDDSIVEINATTMQYVDHFQVPYKQRIPDGDIGASVTLYNSSKGVPMVADTDKNGVLYALRQANLSSGPVWSDRIGINNNLSWEYSSASFSKGILYVGASVSTLLNGQRVPGAMLAVNGSTGAILWIHSMKGWVFGPVATTGSIAVAAGGKELAVFNTATGATVFKFFANRSFQGGASIVDGRIYIGNSNGELYVFGHPLTVSIKATPSTGPRILHVAFTSNVYGGSTGYVYNWTFGDGSHYGTSADPNHAYTHKGTYTVTLTVTDKGFDTARATTTVVVT